MLFVFTLSTVGTCLASRKTWTCKILLARQELQDLQEKNSPKNSIFQAKNGVFKKNSANESSRKILNNFFMLINEDIPVYLMSKNGIYFIYASLAGLARNPEFSLASRKTSKVQEIAHYNPELDLFLLCSLIHLYKLILGYFEYFNDVTYF